MQEDTNSEKTVEIWVQDLTDRNLFYNRKTGLRLPESALQGRPRAVMKIMYDHEGTRVLPTGYFWGIDDQVAIDPRLADVIRLVFDLRGRGLSIEKIIKKLEDTPSGPSDTVWHPSNIREILDNEEVYRSGRLKSDSSLQLPPIL